MRARNNQQTFNYCFLIKNRVCRPVRVHTGAIFNSGCRVLRSNRFNAAIFNQSHKLASLFPLSNYICLTATYNLSHAVFKVHTVKVSWHPADEILSYGVSPRDENIPIPSP